MEEEQGHIMVVARLARRPRRALAGLLHRVERRSEARLRAAEDRLALPISSATDPVLARLAPLERLPARLDSLARAQHEAAAVPEAPAVTAWRFVAPRRREGVCVLLLRGRDAHAVRAAEPGPVPFLVVDLDAPADRRAPLPPGHAVGGLVADLDRLDPTALRAVGREAAWLRPEVPVAGMSCSPERAAEQAAALVRAAEGALLPAPATGGVVPFVPGLAPGALREAPVPGPARRRIGTPALVGEARR